MYLFDFNFKLMFLNVLIFFRAKMAIITQNQVLLTQNQQNLIPSTSLDYNNSTYSRIAELNNYQNDGIRDYLGGQNGTPIISINMLPDQLQ